MKPVLLAALALCCATPAWAQPADPSPEPPQRMSTLIVFGNDPCPKSEGDEIVVCARQPESERYRLPKRFRRAAPGAEGEAWANRAATLEYVGRSGTPNSCSPVGSGGQTGCQQQFLRQAREDRRAAAADARAIP